MKKGAYGVVYQDVTRNKNIPAAAKGLYAYLSSFCGVKDECYPSVETITREMGMGRDTFYRHINILVAAGVVEKHQTISENGKFGRTMYRLTHNVEITDFPNTENTDSPNTQNEDTCFSTTAHKETNINNTNINNINNNINNNTIGFSSGIIADKCPDKSPDENPDISPPEIRDKRLENKDRDRYNKYSVHFEAFWSIYPRKKEKAKAYKAYNTRLKDGFSEEELLTAATAYAKECADRKTEERYIKLAATFLGPSTPFTDYLGKKDNGSSQQSAKSTRFSNFDQRNYDFDELEKQLLEQ